MRNKLSYYSVILLVGLAVASGLILIANPFNGAPASASPSAPTAAHVGTTATSTNSTSTVTSTAVPAPVPIVNGFGDDSQPGGTADGDHHHSDYPGLGGLTGNSTTTTSTSVYYSQNA